jgi:hypothetical protein
MNVNGLFHIPFVFVLALATKVEMVLQPCMMRPGAPGVSTLSLAEDGSAVRVRFSRQAWMLIESSVRWNHPHWDTIVRGADGAVLRIPIVRRGTPAWREAAVALEVFATIVFTLQIQGLEMLAEKSPTQLFWIDGLTVHAGVADIAVVASPAAAAFVREASEIVWARVTMRMVAAERAITGADAIPLTRGANPYNGGMHFSVGEDCACLGVAHIDLPRSDQEGWPAHGHNLRFLNHILLVLVGLAALEDECRAIMVTQ